MITPKTRKIEMVESLSWPIQLFFSFLMKGAHRRQCS
jgi:hypothetical protein